MPFDRHVLSTRCAKVVYFLAINFDVALEMKSFCWIEHSEPEKSIGWKSWKYTRHV